MGLRVELLSGAQDLALQDLPMWSAPRSAAHLSKSYCMVAYRGEELVGLWQIPLTQEEGELVAKREPRLFPYSSPWLKDTQNLKRRRVFQAMVEVLKEQVAGIELPMCPDFSDITGGVELGIFAEWRHTYQITIGDDWRTTANPKLLNHIRSAQRTTEVEILDELDSFRFNRAIVSDNSEVVESRTALAHTLHCSGKATMLQCRDTDQVLGQAFIVSDLSTAYLYHTWFNPDGPRGVPSLLIMEAISWAEQQPGLLFFDFEGSIIASIDRFMANFGAKITPYPYLYWDRSKQGLFRRVHDSLSIEGRQT